MSLLEQIYHQRVEFLRRDMKPTVIVVPYEMRHQLLGEAFDRFGVREHNPGNEIGIMGMRVMFSQDCKRLEVLASAE